MPKIPYIKKVASIALGAIDSVLNHWLPGGEREGAEYLPLNPKRSDSKPGSFSINMKSGKWADFASGNKGLDLVSLVAYLENEPQGKAAERLAAFLGIETEESNTPKRARNDSKQPGNSEPSASRKEPNSAENPGSTDDGWRCLMPIPIDAPEPPSAHSKHGKPSKRYPYHDQNGRINFFHWRFEPKKPGDRKQFCPVSLWVKDGRYEWKFKAPPEPRPLFNLPKLAQHPGVTAWLVEGEKAAFALEKLLPGHPVLTWAGGSQAVSKSDYRPLTARNCIVWPDNDLPGKKAADDLVKRLMAAGARSVQMLNLEKLALTPGWQADHFALLLKRDDVFVSPDTKEAKPASTQNEQQSETVQRGFELFDDGLYFLEPTKDGRLRRRRVCWHVPAH